MREAGNFCYLAYAADGVPIDSCSIDDALPDGLLHFSARRLEPMTAAASDQVLAAVR